MARRSTIAFGKGATTQVFDHHSSPSHPPTRPSRRWLCTTGAITAACALAACGGSGGGSGKDSNLLAKVRSSHQLTVAISTIQPQDIQTKTGGWTGYDVDILKGFARTLGAHLVFDSIPFSSSIEAVSTHRADITVDIYYTSDRTKVVAYSRPMLNYAELVSVRGTHPLVTQATVAGLTGKSIGVLTGSEELGEANKTPHAKVVQYDDSNSLNLALEQGRIDAMYGYGVAISYMKHKNPSLNVSILGPVPAAFTPPVTSLRGYFTVAKGSYGASFLSKLNAYLKKIACDGTEQRLIDAYGMNSSSYLAGICEAPNKPPA